MHIAAMPQHRTEAARVAQPHQRAVSQRQIEVVVLFRRRAARQDAQAAGHAEMQDQCAAIEDNQQIFAAPLQRADSLPAHQFGQVFRDRPAQPGIADNGIRNSYSGEMRGEAAPGDFYFG
jgi:hypothetical protein